VTLTGDEVVVLPAVSRATALSWWPPLVAPVVFHDTLYPSSELVSSGPRGLPSSWNCTPATPLLSVAVAPRVTVPETGAPPAGEVTLTVGAVVSALLTVTPTAAEVLVLPAAS